MKVIIPICLLLSFHGPLFAQPKVKNQKNAIHIVTTDINNFWQAYDKILSTKDSAEQYGYLNSYFLEKGSPGLKAIMSVRDYTATSYIDAIHNYPKFWKSIKANTLKAETFAKEIEQDALKIKQVFPKLKPATIYFTMGAFLTGGTTMDSMILIGSEIALADEKVVSSELPQSLEHLKTYFKSNPIQQVAFSNTHELIHTQQKTTVCDNLIGQSLMEGVAEFVAVIGTGKSSSHPAIEFGKKNEQAIRDAFSAQLFNSYTGYWLYSNATNPFNNQRDLGYVVGYQICQAYYQKEKNKKAAIEKMILLDYNQPADLAAFVDQSGYFSKSMKTLQQEFDLQRPYVTKIEQFANGDSMVSPDIKEITLHFSAPIDERYRSFELGPLGEKNSLRLVSYKGMSADKKSVRFEIQLKPKQRYQIIVGSGFRSQSQPSLSLKPYLLDFTTK
ncbi:MAG: hypothetical protein B7Y69_02840 [Sphingobacteriia bacterium 35-40-8]|nr:MAG: hypothetical protein B7Y69_02840 [Sphingobacteriia bacterium 35-40-8]OZA63629.1 MAG: hypothetical protein B7X72_10055 [Sphingobacteriia bacterium 39-39-8]HQR93457.1 hypothetical protein [Sediminibacterium sp.]